MLTENIGRLNRKRTVHPNFKTVMSMHEPFFFDTPDEVQHLLRPSDCKRWYHNISPAVKCSLDHLCQRRRIVCRCIVAPITVGRLHQHIICLGRILRIADQRLIAVPDITGKDDLLLGLSFFYPHLDRRGSKQMARVNETNLYPLRNSYLLTIPAAHKTPQRPFCIFHIIEWLHHLTACAHALAVLPLCLKHLNVRAVTQHNLTQIGCRRRRKYLPLESFLI